MITGQRKVRLLYEEYIHLESLKKVWAAPITAKPELEPYFAAGLHGVEIGFLLLSEFIQDSRRYVAKQPRIEAVVADVRAQLQLLQSVVDGELEEEWDRRQPCLSLTQSFPFESCPPTTSGPSHSPGLARLVAAVQQASARLSRAELASLTKVSLILASSFADLQARWTVGLGLEQQLNQLVAFTLPPQQQQQQQQQEHGHQGQHHTSQQQQSLPAGMASSIARDLVPVKEHNLDYSTLVRPEVVEATLTDEIYDNEEDFFFRSVHLGTECWMFVANARLQSALEHAEKGNWHVAAARTMQAARILQYLGDHVLLLTRMNLRDYLVLKVQLEGTSGAGSSLVRATRPLVTRLFQPLKQAAMQMAQGHNPPSINAYHIFEVNGAKAERADSTQDDRGSKMNKEDSHEGDLLMCGLLELYANPDNNPGLYNYAKALEDVESAVLGGFYYKHYVLATNVIGSAAKGTMRSAVAALKQTYERQLFPELDVVRSTLGDIFDTKLAHIRGRMMDKIMERWQAIQKSKQAIPTPHDGAHVEAQAETRAATPTAECPFFGSSYGGESAPSSAEASQAASPITVVPTSNYGQQQSVCEPTAIGSIRSCQDPLHAVNGGGGAWIQNSADADASDETQHFCTLAAAAKQAAAETAAVLCSPARSNAYSPLTAQSQTLLESERDTSHTTLASSAVGGGCPFLGGKADCDNE